MENPWKTHGKHVEYIRKEVENYEILSHPVQKNVVIQLDR